MNFHNRTFRSYYLKQTLFLPLTNELIDSYACKSGKARNIWKGMKKPCLYAEGHEKIFQYLNKLMWYKIENVI